MTIDGIINIFKPKGMSSFSVVREIRNILKIKKVGHTGTLDPNASGVLLICLGQSTKISQFIMDFKKTYQGEMILGIKTDTQDSEGKVIERININEIIEKQRIEEVFKKYTGVIQQAPPMFSAAYHHGKRLYKLARKGIEVKRNAKEIHIYRLTLLDLFLSQNPTIKFEVLCSKGTYVRTLCDDIGKELGYGAYMSKLKRIKVGNHSVNDSITLEALRADKKLVMENVISIDRVLQHFPQITIKQEFEDLLLHGGFVYCKHLQDYSEITYGKGEKIVKIKNGSKKVLSIARETIDKKNEKVFKPIRVFNA